MDPVSQRLAIHPAASRRIRPTVPIEDLGDCQHPPRRMPIPRPPGLAAQIRRCEVLPGNRNRDHLPPLIHFIRERITNSQHGQAPRVSDSGRWYKAGTDARRLPAVTIRRADPEADLFHIVEGAALFADEAKMGPFLPADFDDFTQAVARMVNLPSVTVLLATEGERIFGGLGFYVGPYLWNHEVKYAEELFFWTHPEAPKSAALKLLKAAQKEIKAQNAAFQIFSGLCTSPSKIGAVYQKMGLKPLQLSFIGVV